MQVNKNSIVNLQESIAVTTKNTQESLIVKNSTAKRKIKQKHTQKNQIHENTAQEIQLGGTSNHENDIEELNTQVIQTEERNPPQDKQTEERNPQLKQTEESIPKEVASQTDYDFIERLQNLEEIVKSQQEEISIWDVKFQSHQEEVQKKTDGFGKSLSDLQSKFYLYC